MIRQSAKRTFKQILDNCWEWKINDLSYTFDQQMYVEVVNYLQSNDVFLEIRCLMLMLVLPKRINKKDCYQAAYLRAAISRVT